MGPSALCRRLEAGRQLAWLADASADVVKGWGLHRSTAQIPVDFSAFPLAAEQPADPDEQDGGNGNADTGAEQ
jgi:hypothetical protein